MDDQSVIDLTCTQAPAVCDAHKRAAEASSGASGAGKAKKPKYPKEDEYVFPVHSQPYERTERTCCGCHVAWTAVFFAKPCHHLVFCPDCALVSHVRLCPICGQMISSLRRIFLV